MDGPWNGGRSIARSSSLVSDPGKAGIAPRVAEPPWPPDIAERFWAFWSSHRAGYERYFSYLHAEALVRLLRETGRVPRGGRALDVGCGPGFLLGELMAEGLAACGVDLSVEALRHASSTLAARSNWVGVARTDVTLPFAEASFDALTCVETLEHLEARVLESMLGECYRVLKPGGTALFTTPCDEDLSRDLTYCPFCNAAFHSVLHVASFSVESLSDRLRRSGFQVLFCRGLNLDGFESRKSSWKDFSPRRCWRAVGRAWQGLLDRVAPRQFPNNRLFVASLLPGPHLCALALRLDPPGGQR